MKYELYDILTLNGKDYSISSKIVDGDSEYFLLLEIDENENPIVQSPLILRHSLLDVKSNQLFPVQNETEFTRVKQMLMDAMIDDLK